jgi:hypothetical protein
MILLIPTSANTGNLVQAFHGQLEVWHAVQSMHRNRGP